MIRETISCAVMALFMNGACLAQESEENKQKNWHVKLYGQSTFEERINTAPIFSSSTFTRLSSDRLLSPTVAFGRKTKNGNQYEIELTAVSINSYENKTIVYGFGGEKIHVAGSKIYETYFAARYEYILNFVKKQDAKLVPSIGVSASPYYQRYNLVPYASAAYPAKETTIGVRVFIAPRLNYNISKRFFLDLNIPVCLGDINYNIHKEQNPTIRIMNQSVNTANAQLLPKYFSARLGIGIRL